MISNQYLLRTGLLLSLTTPLVAFADPMFTSGFYAGAKIGAQGAIAEYDVSNALSVQDTASNFILTLNDPDQDAEASRVNLMGNIGVGYAFVKQRFFLAGEASVNLSEEQKMSWTDNEILG